MMVFSYLIQPLHILQHVEFLCFVYSISSFTLLYNLRITWNFIQSLMFHLLRPLVLFSCIWFVKVLCSCYTLVWSFIAEFCISFTILLYKTTLYSHCQCIHLLILTTVLNFSSATIFFTNSICLFFVIIKQCFFQTSCHQADNHNLNMLILIYESVRY